MLEMSETGSKGFYYSPEHVVDYCLFAESLSHFEAGAWEQNQIGPGGEVDQRIILEPWQIWIEAAIQGFRRVATDVRLVTRALELVPRKHGKSLKAAIAVLHDLGPSGVTAPEIVIAAASTAQADKTIYGDLVKMLANEPEYVEHYGVVSTNDEIRAGSGKVIKLTSRGDKEDGLNPSLAIFEEGHAGAAQVYNVVDSSFGARPGQLLRMITTAGLRPEGPAFELIQDAKRILSGQDEDWTFFAALYTLDEEDYLDENKAIDWERLFTDDDLLIKANPMYGISLDPLTIRTARNEARRRPDKRAELARTRFNIWTNAGSSAIPIEAWAACKRDIRLEDFIGKKCWIGVDLASKHDMCAISLVFDTENGGIAVFAKFYIPENSPTTKEPELFDRIMAWSETEHLVLTSGVLADHKLINEEIEAFCQIFDVQLICCDPYQAHNTIKPLWEAGFPVVTYDNKAVTMTEPTDEMIGHVINGSLAHDGNPVLAWNVQNMHVERKDNGSMMPRKPKKGSKEKIDGIVAAILALGGKLNPDQAIDPEKGREKYSSFYERDDLWGRD